MRNPEKEDRKEEEIASPVHGWRMTRTMMNESEVG